MNSLITCKKKKKTLIINGTYQISLMKQLMTLNNVYVYLDKSKLF